MPSRFPGMDPFIEGQRWVDFHTRFITALSDLLVPQVRPRYFVEVEERVYVEYGGEAPEGAIRPDVTVAEKVSAMPTRAGGQGTASGLALAPARLTLPAPMRNREIYLTLREKQSGAVVSVIELLSPANKRAGSAGRAEYLTKRDTILQSSAHLVELDLLRGGVRLPTVEPLPAGDYYAFISRAPHRPEVEVYGWSLHNPLPTLPLPLREGEPDVRLDLQAAFTSVYDRAGYDYSLDYSHPVEPLSEADAEWVRQVLGRA